MQQLAAHAAEFEASGAGVVTLTFGTAAWAHTWLAETASPFPLLRDPARAAYMAYGLKRSVLRSWTPRNLLFYARALAQGRELRGQRGDANQLGGTFLVDRAGVVRLAHANHDPTQVLTVRQLLAAVANVESNVRN